MDKGGTHALQVPAHMLAHKGAAGGGDRGGDRGRGGGVSEDDCRCGILFQDSTMLQSCAAVRRGNTKWCPQHHKHHHETTEEPDHRSDSTVPRTLSMYGVSRGMQCSKHKHANPVPRPRTHQPLAATHSRTAHDQQGKGVRGEEMKAQRGADCMRGNSCTAL